MTFPGDPGEREDIPVDPMIVSTFAQSFRAMEGLKTFWDCWATSKVKSRS
jgi:hypothetical protein